MSRYIDAELIEYHPQQFFGSPYGGNKYDIVTRSEVEKIPTADVQEIKHGHWIELGKREEDGNYVFQCPHCNETWAIPCKNAKEFHLNNCANCGTQMDEEGDK